MTFRFSSSCPLGGDIYQHCSEWCYFKGQTFAVYAVKNIFAVVYFLLCTTSAHEKNKITIKKKKQQRIRVEHVLPPYCANIRSCKLDTR